MREQEDYPEFNDSKKMQLENQKKLEQQKAIRENVLVQILTQDARARLGRIATVKPERATAITNYLLSMVQNGNITDKINEECLVKILSQISKQEEQNKPKIKIQRRKNYDSDDSS